MILRYFEVVVMGDYTVIDLLHYPLKLPLSPSIKLLVTMYLYNLQYLRTPGSSEA